jgi:hypothetical protein
MKEAHKNTQLELFSGQNNSASHGIQRDESFIKYIQGYERVILLIIAFLACGIISFSLGVEKGKRVNLASKLIEPTDLPKPIVVPLPQKQEETKEPAKDLLQNYTVQVASYKTRQKAESEAKNLRKKGHQVLVLSKGNYIVVCAGSFSTKTKAQTILSQLKKEYRDCILRRL